MHNSQIHNKYSKKNLLRKFAQDLIWSGKLNFLEKYYPNRKSLIFCYK